MGGDVFVEKIFGKFLGNFWEIFGKFLGKLIRLVLVKKRRGGHFLTHPHFKKKIFRKFFF